MKRLLLSLSLLAIVAVGCNNTATDNAQKGSSDTKSTTSESDHSDLLAEVDKNGLESAIAANEVTLIEFTAVW